MKYLILILGLCCLSQDTRADDIKDYVEYQAERKRTFDDAYAHHQKTKKTVYFWVGLPDSEAVFKVWKATRSYGYHVFLKSHPQMNKGITIGQDRGGQFRQIETVPLDAHTIERLKCPDQK